MSKYINKYALLMFGLLTILVFNAAIFAQTRNEVWIIADRQTDCTGVAKMKCLQVKKPQDDKWTLLAQNIEKFNYEDGYTYVVRVKIDTVKNPPTDASSLKYTLKKVLNREKTSNGNSSENDNGATQPQNNSGLNGKVWRLTAIDGNAVNTDKATLSFDFDKNRVGGNGGCNGFGGTLSGGSGEIKISQVISTKMFCENGSDVENKYLPKLEQVNKYRIAGGKLQLLSSDKIVLEFTAKS